MMVSTKGRYALRVMIDLAEHQTDGYIPLKEIASRQNISEKYLESIIKSLVKSNMLVGLRGKGGGYRLARDPQDILAGDVLRAVEGTTVPVTCAALDGPEPCHRADVCTTVRFWAGLDEVIEKYVDGVTVGDLAAAPQPHIEIAE